MKLPQSSFSPLTVLPSTYRPPEASWHADYRDTAYIYIGGLPFDLSEGDIIAIFSQYGEPVHVNLVRDKETGKSKGFAFLKYEDQRSTDLAVDNLGGATVMGRLLRVDHARYREATDAERGEGAGRIDSQPRRGRPDEGIPNRGKEGRGRYCNSVVEQHQEIISATP